MRDKGKAEEIEAMDVDTAPDQKYELTSVDHYNFNNLPIKKFPQEIAPLYQRNEDDKGEKNASFLPLKDKLLQAAPDINKEANRHSQNKTRAFATGKKTRELSPMEIDGNSLLVPRWNINIPPVKTDSQVVAGIDKYERRTSHCSVYNTPRKKPPRSPKKRQRGVSSEIEQIVLFGYHYSLATLPLKKRLRLSKKRSREVSQGFDKVVADHNRYSSATFQPCKRFRYTRKRSREVSQYNESGMGATQRNNSVTYLPMKRQRIPKKRPREVSQYNDIRMGVTKCNISAMHPAKKRQRISKKRPREISPVSIWKYGSGSDRDQIRKKRRLVSSQSCHRNVRKTKKRKPEDTDILDDRPTKVPKYNEMMRHRMQINKFECDYRNLGYLSVPVQRCTVWRFKRFGNWDLS